MQSMHIKYQKYPTEVPTKTDENKLHNNEPSRINNNAYNRVMQSPDSWVLRESSEQLRSAAL